MKSVKLQLLVTLAAVIVSAGFLASRGLPPSQSISGATAVWYGNPLETRRNANWGVDINTKDDEGRTPLDFAVDFHGTEVAEILIAHEADVNAKDHMGLTPLHWAAYGGDVEVADILIAHGANVEAKGDEAQTPLHETAYLGGNGCIEMAKLLLAHGANVNAQDKEGRTPLHYAVAGGHRALADLLRQHGAKE